MAENSNVREFLDEHASVPGKKDRTRWCKGKKGREHTLVVKVPDNLAGWAGMCREAPGWWQQTRAYRENPRPWWCMHRWVCTTCGKQLARPARCPDTPPEILAQLEADHGPGPKTESP